MRSWSLKSTVQPCVLAGFLTRERNGMICLWSLLILFGGARLEGGSVLHFPRLSAEVGRLTGLAIANPTSAEAAVVLTAYAADGSLLAGAGITNPKKEEVPGGGQLARLTSELFGDLDPELVRWIRAESEADDLTGFFLFLDFALTSMDGADLPAAAEEIVFNEVFLGEGFSTELNLINVSEQPAEITLTLRGTGVQVEKNLELAALGAARLDAASFFEVAASAEAFYVQASSPEEIAGFELVRGPDDLMGLNAKPLSEQLNTLFFPQLAVGGPFESEVGITNSSEETVILTLTAFRGDGQLFGAEEVTQNPVTRFLAAGGTLREDLAEMFGFSGSEQRDGWLKVEASSEDINGALSYRLPDRGAFAAVAAEGQGRSQALFSHLATIEGLFTGVAILNAGALTANLRVVAADKEGTVLGTHTTALRSGQRISKLITELVEDADGQGGGFIWISSDVPVYLTSLFGRFDLRMLSNIPPQPVPPGFQPDQGIVQARLTPSIVFLQEGQANQFALQGFSGTPQWSVNGEQGGGAAFGMITAGGLYQAPATAPELLPVSVTAGDSEQTAGASVDVLSKEVVEAGLGELQTIAYLEALARLYAAELKLLGAETSAVPRQVSFQSSDSVILDVTGESAQQIAEFPGEMISKMIPFEGIDGAEYLLLAGRDTGRIIRLNPLTGSSQEVASGLILPNALVIDPATGDLLVAVDDGVVKVLKSALNLGLTAAARLPGPSPRPGFEQVTDNQRVSGVAVDRCTGDLYIADASTGVVFKFDRLANTLSVVVTGLEGPTQLLALYRRDVSCNEAKAFHLLVAEPPADQISIFLGGSQLVSRWIAAAGIRDLLFLPLETPLAKSAGVLSGEFSNAQGNIFLTALRNLYTARPVNPPNEAQSECLGSVQLSDPNLAAVVRDTLGLGPEAFITCQDALGLIMLSADSSQISDLQGMENFVNLEDISLDNNQIRDLTPLGNLTRLQHLSLQSNLIRDATPVADLTALRTLNLGQNQISDIGPLVQNTGLGNGDRVEIAGNALDREDCGDIAALIERGVEVIHDVVCGSGGNLVLEIIVDGPDAGPVFIFAPNLGETFCEPSGEGTCLFSIPAESAVFLGANSLTTPGVLSGGTGSASECAFSTCMFLISESSSIRATFDAALGPFPSVMLTIVLRTGPGTGAQVNLDGQKCVGTPGETACQIFYASGSLVTIDAQQGTGTSFEGYSGACSGTSSICTLAIVEDVSVTATFGPG